MKNSNARFRHRISSKPFEWQTAPLVLKYASGKDVELELVLKHEMTKRIPSLFIKHFISTTNWTTNNNEML